MEIKIKAFLYNQEKLFDKSIKIMKLNQQNIVFYFNRIPRLFQLKL